MDKTKQTAEAAGKGDARPALGEVGLLKGQVAGRGPVGTETVNGASSSGNELPLRVVISGAGPSGLLLAHYLLAFGGGRFQVHIFERAEDPRETVKRPLNSRRYSMGIALRGENAISLVPGLLDQLRPNMVEPSSWTVLSPFSKSPSSLKFAKGDRPGLLVDRFALCATLLQALVDMTEAKQLQGLLSLHFHWACADVDLEQQKATFRRWGGDAEDQKEQTVVEQYDLLVGADGVRSVVRLAFEKQIRDFEVEQAMIPSTWTQTHFLVPDSYPKDALHILPEIPNSDGISAMGIPAPDGSLCFIMGWIRWGSPKQWMACATPKEAKAFFDARVPHLQIPEEAAWAMRNAPMQTAKQIKCWQYHDTWGHAVLIGDAAHATSPSLGQGCNASLVDSCVLGRLLLGEVVGEGNRSPSPQEYSAPNGRKFWAQEPSAEEIRDRLPGILEYFSALQVKEGQALVDMSNSNAPVAPWAKALHTCLLLFRIFFCKLLPFLVPPPLIGSLGQTTTPFSVVYRQFKTEVNLFLKSNEETRQQKEAELAKNTVAKGLPHF